MTSANATLLTAAIAFIGVGVASVQAGNWIAGVIEFVVGIGAVVVYEKLPPSTTA
ncbi:MAG TPA: hypothetical protein VKB38_13285 [Terracidiphilus sp.]|nr:hypothetical protein [Terracidiphilus sp.]